MGSHFVLNENVTVFCYSTGHDVIKDEYVVI